MKATDVSLKFVCPVCGAQPREVCEINSGIPRFESHHERRAVTAKSKGKRTHNMEHLSAWHDFSPDSRSTYPKVVSPVEVEYADERRSEGDFLKLVSDSRALHGSQVTRWRYIRHKAVRSDSAPMCVEKK